METEEIKRRKDQLLKLYQNATGVDKQNLKVRGLLLKYALEKREPTPKLI